ncbi:hypothetical protein J4E91_010502 [Alternaria rosae]|nr:hypothetical protein J4E91_010502 [Alternaria rosae]
MEIAGVVVGVIGLAALFETCMNAFQHTILRLAVLELRLSQWGEKMRFVEDSTGDSSAATVDQSTKARALLGQIQDDLNDAEKASTRYRLPTSGSEAEGLEGSESLEDLAKKFRSLTLHRQKRRPVLSKARWALQDKRKFEVIINDVRHSIDDLEQLFPGTQFPTMNQELLKMQHSSYLLLRSKSQTATRETETKTHKELIPLLKEITADTDHLLQQAILVTAANAASGTTIGNVNTAKDAKVAIGHFIASGYTGPLLGEKGSKMTIRNLNSTDNARVNVGTMHGRSVFDD